MSGAKVGVGVRVGLGVWVAVGVRVGLRVAVGIGVKVEVGAAVWVGEAIKVMLAMTSLVAVGVGTADNVHEVRNKARNSQNNLRDCIFSLPLWILFYQIRLLLGAQLSIIRIR